VVRSWGLVPSELVDHVKCSLVLRLEEMTAPSLASTARRRPIAPSARRPPAAARSISNRRGRSDGRGRALSPRSTRHLGARQADRLTGPPVSGKSTLRQAIALELRARGRTVGVIRR